jgi:DNA-binding transcriptional LysR family regulator
MMLNQINLARFDLNLLVVFDVVLAEKHVARAASRLNLTPSAVSHALGRLRRLLNDPLFLRTPKGVVPTARALELAAPVAEILERVKGVVGAAARFDPRTSGRRFLVGAPDAVLTSMTTPLVEHVSATAPNVDMGLVHLMPVRADQPWQESLELLEQRGIDVAVIPLHAVPPRFVAVKLYDEEFVVAMRKGHAFAQSPTLEAYCGARHLLVSQSGDPRGFLDDLLAERGRRRHVALTVPAFMLALDQLAKSDLIATLPRRFVVQNAARFGLVSAELPVRRKPDRLYAVTTKAALLDDGVAWLRDVVVGSAKSVT